MSDFVCDGTCAGNELGDCSHPEAVILTARLAAERAKVQQAEEALRDAWKAIEREADAFRSHATTSTIGLDRSTDEHARIVHSAQSLAWHEAEQCLRAILAARRSQR